MRRAPAQKTLARSHRLRWGAVVIAAASILPGCAFRRNMQSTTVSSNVEIDQGGSGGVATLTRDQYHVNGTSAGKDKTTRVFVLWFPVGNHKSSAEVWDSAYSDAVDRGKDCDGLLLPRTRVKRVVVPLLLVNVIVKKVEVKGRCIHIKDDEALARGWHHGRHHGQTHGKHPGGRHGKRLGGHHGEPPAKHHHSGRLVDPMHPAEEGADERHGAGRLVDPMQSAGDASGSATPVRRSGKASARPKPKDHAG